ncbi:ankyrin repeat domain-containing protein 35 isoform X2 [Corvus hawaiiensis]|uniref:ankyrin repeat domain-containing protein 35 isoform X2 n=1 Tax=Corvus hawaiiensis TaxID=134902 RepID=UPI002019F899|nr:ankyrin repeat domain-containing protein 35 isoform X2 [Corvus hawaiiensis]
MTGTMMVGGDTLGTPWGHLGDTQPGPCVTFGGAQTCTPRQGKDPREHPGECSQGGGVPKEGVSLDGAGCPLGVSPRRGCPVGVSPVPGPVPTGSTALHLATIACQPQCVKVLLQHGANERHVDGQNRTPLHWAASSGCASSILLLCDHDAPLDVPDTHGQTPLMLAARGNHAAACAQLLRRGAEPGLADRDGRTALELALAHGSLEAAELLQSHQKDKDTGNVTGNVTGKAPSWALRKVPHCVGRENGAGQVGIQGEEEEEEAEEQRDGRAARRLREELVRKTLECRRLEEAAGGIRRRLRELLRLLPGRDAGEEEEEDEEDDGACLELLARRVAELRKRTRDEEGEGGHGNAEAPALIPFLAWLGEECSKMQEAKAGAFCRSQELHREAEDSLRDEAVGRSAAAWEELAAGLEQALDHQDQIHARILQESQILLEKLRREPAAACRCAVNGAEPAAGGKRRDEMPRESGRMEKELLELREGNGKLLVELARLGRERERLQQELRELRDPGKRDEAWRLRRELRALRDGVGARGAGGGRRRRGRNPPGSAPAAGRAGALAARGPAAHHGDGGRGRRKPPERRGERDTGSGRACRRAAGPGARGRHRRCPSGAAGAGGGAVAGGGREGAGAAGAAGEGGRAGAQPGSAAGTRGSAGARLPG